MKKIIFSGKPENGTWIYGELARTDIGSCITSYDDIDLDCCASSFDNKYFGKIVAYKVLPETVGQLTGLTDKNGREIYEGDILEYNTEKCYVVVYSTEELDSNTNEFYIGAFMLKEDHNFHELICSVTRPYKYSVVIGNTHDNLNIKKEI